MLGDPLSSFDASSLDRYKGFDSAARLVLNVFVIGLPKVGCRVPESSYRSIVNVESAEHLPGFEYGLLKAWTRGRCCGVLGAFLVS